MDFSVTYGKPNGETRTAVVCVSDVDNVYEIAQYDAGDDEVILSIILIDKILKKKEGGSSARKRRREENKNDDRRRDGS